MRRDRRGRDEVSGQNTNDESVQHGAETAVKSHVEGTSAILVPARSVTGEEGRSAVGRTNNQTAKAGAVTPLPGGPTTHITETRAESPRYARARRATGGSFPADRAAGRFAI